MSPGPGPPPCAWTVYPASLYQCGELGQAPLLRVEEGEDVLARHEALLHVTQLQVVHGQHVFLLFLLWAETGAMGEAGTATPWVLMSALRCRMAEHQPDIKPGAGAFKLVIPTLHV